jgi:hypothetical protein
MKHKFHIECFALERVMEVDCWGKCVLNKFDLFYVCLLSFFFKKIIHSKFSMEFTTSTSTLMSNVDFILKFRSKSKNVKIYLYIQRSKNLKNTRFQTSINNFNTSQQWI